MGDDAVQFGGPGGSRRARVRLAAVVVGCLMVTGVVAALVRFGDGSDGPDAGPSARTSQSPSTRSSEPSHAGPGPVVTHATMSWLHARADYRVIVRTDNDVQRFQPVPGRLSRTALPTLRSSGPVYFAAAGDHVFVHPIDFVAAYAVDGDSPAREFHTAAGQGGALLPGPDPRHVWVSGGRGSGHRLVLVGLHGGVTSTRMRYPGNGYPLVPDGMGYAVAQAVDGVYDVRPAGIRRVADGALLATGGGRVLASDCDDRGTCRAVVMDLATGRRHVLPEVPVHRWPAGTGVISPDGHTAAMENGAVTLVDLDTGDMRAADPSLAVGPYSQSMAWSPDSNWLFVAAAGGDLRVIDARRGGARSITLFGAVRQVIVQSSG